MSKSSLGTTSICFIQPPISNIKITCKLLVLLSIVHYAFSPLSFSPNSIGTNFGGLGLPIKICTIYFDGGLYLLSSLKFHFFRSTFIVSCWVFTFHYYPLFCLLNLSWLNSKVLTLCLVWDRQWSCLSLKSKIRNVEWKR